jgi:hypothetical protein
MTRKNIQNYERNSYKFEQSSFDFDTKLSSSLNKIKLWGEVTWCPSIKAVSGFLEKLAWTIEMKICDKTIYQHSGKPFPPPHIAEKIVKAVKKLPPKTTAALFDQDMNPFACKFSLASEWEIFTPTNVLWKPLTLEDLHTLSDGDSRPIIWRVGDMIFKNHSTYINDPLYCLVLGLYCDKYIPLPSKQDKTPLTKVSRYGFGTIAMFLWRLIYTDKNLTEHSINNAYTAFDENNLVPLIPKNWHKENIELLDVEKLRTFGVNTIIRLSKEREANAEKDKEEESKSFSKELTTDSSRGDSNKDSLLKDAIDHVNKQIKAESWETSDGGKETKKLSKILSEDLSLFGSNLWEDEFIVEIDTAICEGGLGISEEEMLFAICCYGCLEILIEEVSMTEDACKELEESIEEKYGISCMFYYTTDARAINILGKSELLQ